MIEKLATELTMCQSLARAQAIGEEMLKLLPLVQAANFAEYHGAMCAEADAMRKNHTPIRADQVEDASIRAWQRLKERHGLPDLELPST